MAIKGTKKATARPTRSKAETQKDFLEIQQEVEAERQSADVKAVETNRLREEHVRHAVESVSVEAVVQRITGLGLDISRALANVSEKMTAEVDQLGVLREAVAIERKEIERLHKIDVAATALDQLVQDHASTSRRLEAEIAMQRAEWEEEAANSARDRKEQEEFLKKQRQREIDDYEYKKTLERKKAQDKYEEEIRLRDKKNQEQQESLENSWRVREAALKEREDEFSRLQTEVGGFPGRLQKEIEVAALRGHKESEARLEQRILILEKDAATEKRVAELRIASLEEALSQKAAHIATLEKQLADAKQQVQDIAVKAIEGASGARALSHINQIAMEQAKNRPQN
jgi:hypothetical protein